jgi:asparagine synthase (glutamine-hydrolysing)
MCGISGIYNLSQASIDIQDLKFFTDSMSHRGPDASDYKLLDNNTLGLGQRRLSILDLSNAGLQPMSYDNERFTITYNGEIFNFQEIRSDLMASGHQFKSDTDTEVILAAYMEWGPLCLKKFNGMWAFAIWDNRNRELFLARDRFGIKPLYYAIEDKQRFAFASETRAFKFLKGFNRQINEFKLSMNIADAYALEGLGHTIFDEVNQLLPGHFMIVKRNEKITQNRWWHIEDCNPDVPRSFEDQAAKFYEIFRDACRLRLISDVPVATALSGGLDSTAVYSTVFDLLSKSQVERVNADAQRAFTAVFPGLPQDEQQFAQLAANYTGGPIQFIEPNALNLVEKIKQQTELCDYISNSPITSIASVYEGMRKAGIVVSMDGHGVDEMMYGYRDMVYSLYNEALWYGSKSNTKTFESVLIEMYHPEHRNHGITKFNKRFEDKLLRESSIRYKLKKAVRKDHENLEYLPNELPKLSNQMYDFSKKPLSERMVYNEFFIHTLPALLRNFDRAGMINSVEIRMPFMDWRLVSFVFNLPMDSKIGNGFTKRILREAMKGKMDESLRTRTFKVGIASPIEYWMNGPIKEWAFDNIQTDLKIKAENALKSNKIMDLDLVREIWHAINLELIK